MSIPARIVSFYAQAWRHSVASPTGRRLWLILLIKVGILLLLFKLLFFPDRLQTDYSTDSARAEAVRAALTGKAESGEAKSGEWRVESGEWSPQKIDN